MPWLVRLLFIAGPTAIYWRDYLRDARFSPGVGTFHSPAQGGGSRQCN